MSPTGDALPDDVEFLDVGPADDPGGPVRAVRHRPRWVPLLLVGVAAALVLSVVIRNGDKPAAAPAASASPSPSEPKTSPPASEKPRPVVVTSAGRPLLGVTAGWELFGRGDGVVVRIQPALGLVTRTQVPALTSDGPVTFLVTADRAMVRPLDLVPGYVVPDGRPSRMLSGRLGLGGPLLPGPDSRHVWLQSDDRHPSLTLVGLDGVESGSAIVVPDYSSAVGAVPDGAGYLLFTGTGGVYDAHPDGLHRITTGSLVGLGPTGWLVVECDVRHRCESVAVDRATGARHVVAAELDTDGPLGATSPDGTAAAVYDRGPGGITRLYLVDLRSGSERRADVAVPVVGEGGLAWSPDGRWLFVLGADGRPVAVDARTGRSVSLGVALPPLHQIAVRGG